MHHNVKQLSRKPRLQKWTGGLDYFRWITGPFDETRELVHTLDEIQRADISKASSLKPWRFQGYDGWQTDSVRWGQRGGRVLWESSGEKALSILQQVAPSSGYASRIDLQTTMSLCTPLPTFGSSLLKSIVLNSRSKRRTPIRCGLHSETSGLWLGTVGRRTGHSYLRIYDKGVESNLAPRGLVWRVELEAKASHARGLWQKNRSNLGRPDWCAQYSVDSLISSGCSWPFGRFVEEELDISVGRKEQSTPTRLMAWLAFSVRPVIQRLLTVYTVDEVKQTLGILDAVASTGRDNARPVPVRHEGSGRL